MHWSADVIDLVAGAVRPPGSALVKPDVGRPFVRPVVGRPLPTGRLGTALDNEGTLPTGKIDPTFGKVESGFATGTTEPSVPNGLEREPS